MESLGERLRHIRGILGLSQADLGKTLEIRAKDISRYETGEYSLNPEVMSKLALKGVNMDWLMTEIGYSFRGIGARLRTAREQNQWKPRAFAERMGIPVEQLYKYEDGKEAPPEEWIEKVAATTGADPRWLRTGWDTEGNYTPNIFCGAAGAPPVPAGDTVAEPASDYEVPPGQRRIPISTDVQWAYLEIADAARKHEFNDYTVGHITGVGAEMKVNGSGEAAAREEMQRLLNLAVKELERRKRNASSKAE